MLETGIRTGKGSGKRKFSRDGSIETDGFQKILRSGILFDYPAPQHFGKLSASNVENNNSITLSPSRLVVGLALEIYKNMKERFPIKPQNLPEEGYEKVFTGDTALSIDEVNLGERPLTPRAYSAFGNLNVDYFGEVRLFLINKAEDMRKQLTVKDITEIAEDIKIIAEDMERQKKMAEAIPHGWTHDKVVKIEVWHEPNYNGPASLRIRALTKQGYKVTLKILSDLDSKKIVEKRKIAEDFARRFINKEIEFGKNKSPVYEDGIAVGHRFYTRLNSRKLPELKNLTYAHITEWHENKKKKLQ